MNVKLDAHSHSHSIEELVAKRYSCRSYEGRALSGPDIESLEAMLSRDRAVPFGSGIRFGLVAASADDGSALKELGTYGFIKNPAAFIIGAAPSSGMYLEDFGYAMELNLLEVAAMGLGSCWLGGSFTKSRFAAKIGAGADESVPAVASIGYVPADKVAPEKKRMSPARLFFDGNMNQLAPGGGYARALEAVRLAPSANNKQPWRIVKDGDRDAFHFYLERSALYKTVSRVFNREDLQRVDMGIAMCHFELTIRENGLDGSWKTGPAPLPRVPDNWHYTATWMEE